MTDNTLALETQTSCWFGVWRLFVHRKLSSHAKVDVDHGGAEEVKEVFAVDFYPVECLPTDGCSSLCEPAIRRIGFEPVIVNSNSMLHTARGLEPFAD